MKRPRLVLAHGLLLGFLALVPGAFGLGDHGPSPSQEKVANLFTLIMLPALLIGGLVFVILIDAMILFRRGRRRRGPVSTVRENRLLEIIWTIAPALVLVMIALLTLQTLQQVEFPPAASIHVKVVGQQWKWGFQYLNGDLTNASALIPDELDVPVDEVVLLHVTSVDVIHSFFVPALYLKIDAVPGRMNQFWFQATATGEFFTQCAEFCGTGHSLMHAIIKVFNATTGPVPSTYPFGSDTTPKPTPQTAPPSTTYGSSLQLQGAANNIMDVHLKDSGCRNDKFCIEPKLIHVDKNTGLHLRVWDDGTGEPGAHVHNFTFDNVKPFEGLKVDVIPKGQFRWVNISLTQTDKDYQIKFWCNVPGHRDAGMEGVFEVGFGNVLLSSQSGPPEVPIEQYMILGTMGTAAVLAAVYHFRYLGRREH